MEPCVVIASSSPKLQPDSIIRDILETDMLPDPLRLVDGIRSFLWRIDTKYYDAQVHVCAMDEKTIGNKDFAESVNAVILCFDSDSDSGISSMEQWYAYTKEFEAEIKILICDRCYDTSFPNRGNSVHVGISKTEALEWCITHGFELVEINPEEPEESDLEDDFLESLGMKRVVEALKAHLWPNLQLKEKQKQSKSKRKLINREIEKDIKMEAGARITVKRTHDDIIDKLLEPEPTNSRVENRADAESLAEDSFEALFENLSTMKSKAANLPPTQRKDYAKEMTFAFWRAMGGNESEIEDLSSESEDELGLGESKASDSKYKTTYRSLSGRPLRTIPESEFYSDEASGSGGDNIPLNGPTSGEQSSSTSDYSSFESDSADSTMNFSSDFSLSEEYQSFRSTVPLRKVALDSGSAKIWKLYDAGPRSVRTPLICLAPVIGTADVFYRQVLALSARGIRVISVESSVYWSVNDWCEGFKKLLDHLDIDKVHLFGASLGGYLAQKFAEYTSQYSRVASLILCNSFMDTSIFNLNESAMVFWMLPSVVLKKMIIGNLSSDRRDLSIAQAIDFMTERLDMLSQQDISSRLTINCVNSYVDTFKLRNVKITLIDVFDEAALSSQAREDMYKSYSHAKMAHLKTGGNFPYLSRSDEVNMHIVIHLRAFNDTRLNAMEPCSDKPIDAAAFLDTPTP